MSKRSFRIALAIVVSSLLVVGGVATCVVIEALQYPTKERDGEGVVVEVTIEPGMSFPDVAQLLADKEVVDKPLWFRLYAMHRGVTTKVRSGDYVLRDDMSPEQVLDELLEGVEDVTARVTLREGWHILEVFEAIDEAGIADAAALEKIARDPAFLDAMGIDGETVEGYLFPDTYVFRVPTDPEQVLRRLIEQHRIVWREVVGANRESMEKLRKRLGWSDRDFLIMASIVEKEAVVDSERPRIAQVFINRLVSPSFTPHRLDTDPTIRYGCTIPEEKSAGCKTWDPTQRLRRAQLDDEDNPYNTYQHEGLPPGPICNPGRRSLEATLAPDGSGYFFFVSRNDGTHVFSKSRAAHERAVDKYQRGN